MTDSIYSTTRAAGPSTALHTTRTGRSQADTTHESILPDQPKGGFKDLFGEVGEDVVDQMSQNFSDSPQDEDTSIGHKVFDYLERSGEQFVMGNYTDEVTLLGTAMQIGSGLVGLDLPGDIRDLTYDLTHWEWSWGHAGQTLLDAAGVLPVVGSLKYLDEAGAVVKSGAKNLDEAAGLANKVQDAAQDVIKNISESVVKGDGILSLSVKRGLDNDDALKGIGSRGVRNIEVLTDVQQSQIYRHVEELGLNPDDFLLSTHMSVYSDNFDKVFLGPNVFPGSNRTTNSVFETMTPRAVIAHEAGHMITTRSGVAFEAGSLFDEVGASLTGRELPGLNTVERYQLLRDAVERAKNQNYNLRDVISQMKGQ